MTDSDGLIDARLRAARPRVVAALLRAFRDVDMAEDMFQEACARALMHWPERGFPDDATAWLIRVGRNAGIDLLRKRSRETDDDYEVVLDGIAVQERVEDQVVDGIDSAHYKDDILRLMFMCCHAELSGADQLALALKVVVGLSVPEIARAFVVTPDAMEQRITRAKKRAAKVATALETPSMVERAARLHAVITMVYLLFNEGYSAQAGDDHIRHEFCREAIRLARLLLDLFPGQNETMGLLALCLLHHARHDARMDDDGRLVPLDQQDRQKWDREAIAEGLVLVDKGQRSGQPAVMVLQAAIAAEHCRAARAELTDWMAIDRAYQQLEILAPSPVVTLNRAVAVWRVAGVAAALDILGPLEEPLRRYRPYYSTLAAFLEESGKLGAARRAFQAAYDLGGSQAEQDYVGDKIAELNKKIS